MAQGKINPEIRSLALSLIRGHSQKDWTSEIKSLHNFVRDNIRYVRDVRGVETLHTPLKLLELGQGDCDDKSVLLATLLESIGHPTRFVAIGFAPNRYDHVYVDTRLRDVWVGLETTEPWPVGRTPKGVTKMIHYN